MWQGYAQNLGLFTPHINNCSTSEVFIPIGGSSLGFCIEQSPRPSVEYVDAREICATVGKRLPSIAEWKFACKYPPSGLTNMTGSGEWASTLDYHMYSNNMAVQNINAPLMGIQSCNSFSHGLIGHFSPDVSVFGFRCVR